MPIPGRIIELVPLLDLRDDLDEADGLNTSQNNTNLDEFFRAVKKGNIDEVKRMLDDSNNPVNINAKNSDGETALQIAIDKNDSDMVNELLSAKGANNELALFKSIYDNDLPRFATLLEDVVQRPNKSPITPTIVAAELGRREILKILIEKGQDISEPDPYGHESEEYIYDTLQSRTTLDCFSGLTTPMYICLKFLHDKEKTNTNNGQILNPLTEAFKLNKKVRQQAEDEPALKSEYLALSKRCTTFATDLCNCCISVDERNALFDVDSDLREDSKNDVVKIIREAINSEDKEFVAHRRTEEYLNAMVYRSILPKLLTKYIFLKALAFTLYTITFPLLALIYNFEIFLCPNKLSSWLSRVLTTPFGKFISHTSQFLVFFILIAASALRKSHRPSGLEILIFITVFGMIVQEFMVFRRHKPCVSYFSKWWNVITAVMLLLFVLSALSWIVGFGITGGWTVGESSTFYKRKDGYYFLLMGNTFFSLGIVAGGFHLVDLFQVSSVLGPLQMSLYRMILDVLKFFLFFGVIFVAFVMGELKLYSYYNSIQVELAAYVHKNFSIDADTNEHFSTLSQSTVSMFWALFDKVDLEDFDTKDKMFEITAETGKLLFAFYSICAVMVALNMLIAMMSTSYDKITQYDIEWKFVRAKLWLEFTERGTMPAPYNLLPIRVINHFFVAKLRQEMSRKNEMKSQEKIEKNIKRVVHRYLHKHESQRKKEVRTVQDLEGITNQKLMH